MKKWIALVIVLGMAGFGVFTSLIMIGPEMKSQPNIRAYQARFPLPPAGVVPVEATAGIPPPATQNPLSATAENLARGRTYYEYYCLPCHGDSADGNGPVGQSFLPHPPDLRSCRGCHGGTADVKAQAAQSSPAAADMSSKKVRVLKDGELLRVILTGVGHRPAIEPPAGMPVLEYTVLPEHRWYLVLYVRTLVCGGEKTGP
ncbi:MAG: c-type cytochrome [Candidatus Brocadiia bacterium]